MTSVYVYIDDRPTTDLASWKNSNDHISATGHPIHFMFGSRVKNIGENNARGVIRLVTI